jgi:hypothetical protein
VNNIITAGLYNEPVVTIEKKATAKAVEMAKPMKPNISTISLSCVVIATILIDL